MNEFDFNFDELEKPIDKLEPSEVKKLKEEKLHSIFDQTIEEFKKKKEKIISFLKDPETIQRYKLNYLELKDTKLVVYQGAPSNDIAWFKWKQYDTFHQMWVKKLFVKNLENVLNLEEKK